jgi:hypothetical protein
MDRINCKELNDAEVKEQYQIKISNRAAALEILNENVHMNKIWGVFIVKLSGFILERNILNNCESSEYSADTV